MASRQEIGKAFFQMLLWKKVCYVEEALAWFNNVQEEHDGSACTTVEELCDLLQAYLSELGKYGFEIKLNYNPLEVRPRQCGKFFCIINTVKDKAVQEAPVLPRRRDIVFFNAIIERLLHPDTEDGEDVGNDYLARVIPVSLLHNPQWIRSISDEDDKNLLHPRDIDKLLAKLDEEKWLCITKLGVEEQRAVWFGPRAIAEIPAVDQELRRRQRAGASLPNWKSTPRSGRYPVVGVNNDAERTPTRSQRSRPGSSAGDANRRASQTQSQSRAPNGQSLASQPGPSQRVRSRVGSRAGHANGHSSASQGTKRSRFIDSEDDSPERLPSGRNSQRLSRRTRRKVNTEDSENNDNEKPSNERAPDSESSEEIQMTMQGSSDEE